MVAPSKLFIPPLKCYHCSQLILHPGIGCCRNFFNNLLIHTVASFKYFSPLLITSLVLKFKSINRELFVHSVKHYLQTVFGASLATSSIFSCICLLRNLLGDFRIYTTLFLPTVLGLQFCWFFPTSVLQLFTTATSQAVLEGLLLQYSNKVTHLILHSSTLQTILFMLNSAIILHYKRKKVYHGFWFIQPHKVLAETTAADRGKNELLIKVQSEICENYDTKRKTKCDHAGVLCRKFLLDGMKSYILYGIALDLLTPLMRDTKRMMQENDGFVQYVIEKFKTLRPNMTAFFISYVAIYRLSSCLLRKYCNQISPDLQHVLSAFLGGVSFICLKRISLITLSLVISTQLLWQQLKATKSGRKQNLTLMILANAPISQMILSLNCGYLVHNYIFNDHVVNPLASGFLNGLTRDKPKNFRNVIRSNDLQSLVDIAKTYCIKTFL